MKTSYVQINGQMYEKGPDNKIVIGDKPWIYVAGRWTPEDGSIARAVMVMPDIKPYHSVIDGSLITSRSRHREHLREHGCIEVGNEMGKARAPEYTASRGLREELAARIYK